MVRQQPVLKYLADQKYCIFAGYGTMVINMGLNNAQGVTTALPEGYIGVYLLIGLLVYLVVLDVWAVNYSLLGEFIYEQANGDGIFTCLACFN